MFRSAAGFESRDGPPALQGRPLGDGSCPGGCETFTCQRGHNLVAVKGYTQGVGSEKSSRVYGQIAIIRRILSPGGGRGGGGECC